MAPSRQARPRLEHPLASGVGLRMLAVHVRVHPLRDWLKDLSVMRSVYIEASTQFSTINPGTFSNSRKLFVTTVNPSLRA